MTFTQDELDTFVEVCDFLNRNGAEICTTYANAYHGTKAFAPVHPASWYFWDEDVVFYTSDWHVVIPVALFGMDSYEDCLEAVRRVATKKGTATDVAVVPVDS